MTAYDPSDRFASLDASRGKVSMPLTSRSLLADCFSQWDAARDAALTSHLEGITQGCRRAAPSPYRQYAAALRRFVDARGAGYRFRVRETPSSMAVTFHPVSEYGKAWDPELTVFLSRMGDGSGSAAVLFNDRLFPLAASPKGFARVLDSLALAPVPCEAAVLSTQYRKLLPDVIREVFGGIRIVDSDGTPVDAVRVSSKPEYDLGLAHEVYGRTPFGQDYSLTYMPKALEEGGTCLPSMYGYARMILRELEGICPHFPTLDIVCEGLSYFTVPPSRLRRDPKSEFMDGLPPVSDPTLPDRIREGLEDNGEWARGLSEEDVSMEYRAVETAHAIKGKEVLSVLGYEGPEDWYSLVCWWDRMTLYVNGKEDGNELGIHIPYDCDPSRYRGIADAKDALLQLWKDIRHMDGGITLAVHPAEGE